MCTYVISVLQFSSFVNILEFSVVVWTSGAWVSKAIQDKSGPESEFCLINVWQTLALHGVLSQMI